MKRFTELVKRFTDLAAARSDAPVDVHQHLWPTAMIEALRSRRRPPLLSGWRLELPGEADYEVAPDDHDPKLRSAGAPDEGQVDLVSLSSPLGLEDLPPDEAEPLLAAWHDGALGLDGSFGAWAAVNRVEPDLHGLRARLAEGFVGLQVPATWLVTPVLLEALAPLLQVCQDAGRAVLVHPGPVPASSPTARDGTPGWWAAVADYPAQLAAAWWAWQVCGRSLLPTLRICFVAGAGLAPLQHERWRARGGPRFRVDPDVFVETSSYGPQAVDALTRALGIDVVVRGSDAPYATSQPFGLGGAAEYAIDVANPRRLLFGGTP